MDILKNIDWTVIGYAFVLIVGGYFIAKQLGNLAERAVNKHFSRHQALLTKRIIFYMLFLIFAISALQHLGFKMSVLLGAAGVFTVAISFASQTAASNLVSGIFLIFESPFKVGDFIKVKDIMGTVDSIDLLSTKILTLDNMRIRIPNETIVKSDILNMTYFKTRRIEILVGVAYASNIEHVKAVLLDLAKSNASVLSKPVPQVLVNAFTDSSIEMRLLAWVKTPDVNLIRSDLHEQIIKRFADEKIDIPFPRLAIYQG